MMEVFDEGGEKMKGDKKLDKMFVVTRVCRADLIEAGISKKDAMKITDSEMVWIASKMADAYCDCCFWVGALEAAKSLRR